MIIQRRQPGNAFVGYVQVIEQPAVVERRRLRLNAAGDLPTDPTDSALVAAKVITCTGFAAAVMQASIQFDPDPADTGVAGVMVTVADNLAQAVARLTLAPDVGGGGLADEDPGADYLSRSNPSISYDFTDSGTPIGAIYLVAVAGAASSPVFAESLVNVRVW